VTQAPREHCYWWDDAPLRELPKTTVEPACDVAIIGAGYTGLSAALTLARAGKSVQVFDRARPGEGASTRNGGILSGNLRLGYSETMSPRDLAMLEEGIAARSFFRAFVEAEGIDCDLSYEGRFTGALTATDFEQMRTDAALAKKHHDIDAHIIEQAQVGDYVGSSAYVGGILRGDIGTMQPAKFHAGLLARAIDAGAIIHGQTPVTALRTNGVDTSRGQVQAGRVIVAANGYLNQMPSWYRRRIVPVKSRIVVTEELSPNRIKSVFPKGSAYGEKRNLYRYFRPTPDGKRVLLGAREPIFGAPPDKAATHVRNALVQIFPQLEDVAITHSWAGNVAFTRDELPSLFTHDDVIYACGYGGSGTIWATWLGRKAGLKALGAQGAQTAFETAPPKAIPFYNGKPWFLPLKMMQFAALDKIKLARK
jgi:glycine/D-amino acid oxidase-like deaminating enzyme